MTHEATNGDTTAQAATAEPELKSFADFWPRYLAEHSQRGTRLLHAAGTITSTTLTVALVATGRWRWLPAALATGYAAAWVGHSSSSTTAPPPSNTRSGLSPPTTRWSRRCFTGRL